MLTDFENVLITQSLEQKSRELYVRSQLFEENFQEREFFNDNANQESSDIRIQEIRQRISILKEKIENTRRQRKKVIDDGIKQIRHLQSILKHQQQICSQDISLLQKEEMDFSTQFITTVQNSK